ncbi:flagellar hook-associated protein FlgK [Sphingobium nicotianae]|uniref:Flagellar hook-associated protein 1 n=1 Tax=Sphingobium nicotianae TaxID=2782607 RepID=A0A9X1IR52_9SPHN|nr:flagellar hook-associated protein FlgK [Sphingobium nicotianae]MBT2187079.1 flagellar hook-associated protein FlgK [Sphingobium nicotianae]
MTATDLYGIGVSGARAYQAAMGAISNNIANTDTTGYSRRGVEIRESPAGSGTTIYYRSGMAYGGVMIGNVVRYQDDYLDAAARSTSTALGSADQRAQWMGDIETALNDGSLGVGQRMTAMFSAVERLASNPTDTTLRTNVLFSFEQVNTAFRQSRTDMVAVQDGIGKGADNETAALNDALKQLAAANEGLRRSADGTAAHVALLDSRDQALAEVSKRLNVTVEYGANDVANVKYGSDYLVQNVSASSVDVTHNTDGTIQFSVGGTAIADPTSGSLGGLVSSAETARDRLTDLDNLAKQYVSDVNTWHTAGKTAGGAAGQPMLSGTDASNLQVLISDPADLAGASTSGVANGNLINISSIRGSGGMEDKWTALVSSHANVVNATLAEQTAASSRDQMAQSARADVSGVNLDREAADLLRYQQAYQACAKIIQVANQIMDSIFQVV